MKHTLQSFCQTFVSIVRRLHPYLRPALALLRNTALVFALYTLCRLTFLTVNWSAYSDSLTLSHALSLFVNGLRFDTSAIFYTNALFLLLHLFPLHWKERCGYYRIVRWLFVVVNSLCIYTNLIDCVYFQYTGRRTTISVLQEFSHEGAGNMAKIMGEQFLANWYLVLLAAGVTLVLWRAYFNPWKRRAACFSTVRSLLAYYGVQLAVLLIFVPIMIIGMRGGATTATRPITISNANQYANHPAETGILLNTPFAVIRTFNKKPFITPHYMSPEEAAAIYSPIHQPASSEPFRDMNVVVFILESFSKQHFGFYNPTLLEGTYEGFTPFLDSLCTHAALTFEYSYANGRRSIEGMPSVLSSLPNFVEPLFLTPASLNEMSGLARELSTHKGYTSAFFHGAENGSMGFQAFARATGFQRYYGRTEYGRDPNYHGDDDFDGTWAIWDEEFLQFYCDEMGRLPEPFVTSVFTATSHTPFNLPARYKGIFPQGRHRLQECVAYTDHALQQFFRKASTQPWFQNTLFVITADHTSAAIDPVYRTTLGHYAVPIILYAPSDTTLRGYDTERTVEQIDIMPTVLNYLHYDHPYLAFGQDMLSTPPDSTFALHYVSEFEGYEYVQGDYTLQFDGQRATHAYRHRSDPLLQRDILSSLSPSVLQPMEQRLKSIIQQYMQRMNDNQLVVRPPKN